MVGDRGAMTDIEHNRRGSLSPGQAELLLNTWRATEPRGPLLLWMWYAFLGFGVVGSLVEREWLAALVFAPIAAFLAALATVAFREARQRRPLPPPATVIAVDGRVVWGATGARHDLMPPVARDWQPEYGWVPVRADGTLVVRQYWRPAPAPRAVSVPSLPVWDRCAEAPCDASAWWSMNQGGYGSGGVSYSGSPPARLPVGDPEALFRVVSDALRFDENDLAYNRRGSLSPRQGAGAVVTLEGVIESCGQPNFGVVGALASSAAAPGGRVVLVLRDPPWFAGRLRTWWLVGGRAIWVPSCAYWAVPPGLAYRVYLDARTERVVSVEPVPHVQRVAAMSGRRTQRARRPARAGWSSSRRWATGLTLRRR